MKNGDAPLAADLFCGCGGISAGLRDAGFRVLAGADIEPNYACTFRHNFSSSAIVTEDISRLPPGEFMKRLGVEPGQLDIVAGGPPCQGFSKNVPRRHRLLEDPNNMLVLTFLKYVEVLQPTCVLMENVAEMKNGFEQSYTQAIVGRLERAGYGVAYQVLNAADYGVPQRRRRAFFIGRKGNVAPEFPRQTHAKRTDEPNLLDLSAFETTHVPVWEAIGDLPSIRHDDARDKFEYRCEPFSDYQRRMRRECSLVANHRPRPLAPAQYERLACLRPGQGYKDLPKHLQPKSGYSGAYGRLTRDMTAPTITRWVFHPGSGRFGHPEDIRVITIREAARLQGFPDDFEFTGSYTQQAGQVGNAVPPLLVEKIAAGLRKEAGHAAFGSAPRPNSVAY